MDQLMSSMLVVCSSIPLSTIAGLELHIKIFSNLIQHSKLDRNPTSANLWNDRGFISEEYYLHSYQAFGKHKAKP